MSGPRFEENLRVVGVSHHTAPVAVRERLAFRGEDLQRALGSILARGFHEAAILSTCNRVEIITVAREGNSKAGAEVCGFLSEFHGVPENEFKNAIYDLKGADAARHLFEVAASLDSQILGETEILSQSKEAYRVAAEFGSCGPVLHRLFERSFFLSKEVRCDGGIGRSQASVSSAAVALANKLFDVKGRKVLVIGTGEMATGIVRALRSAGVSEILVASRTESRAKEFAQREGGKPCEMRHMAEHLTKVDIVLISAAAPHYIIDPSHIRAAMAQRHGKVICLIDISVPRNVDPAVRLIEDSFLFDIDDLEEIARDGRREREQVAERWRPRLAEAAREVLRELQDTGHHDAARKLIDHVAAMRGEVLKQAQTSGMDQKAIEELSRALERLQGRFLHGPLETLKQAAREGDGADAAAWVSRMFKLETAVPGPAAAKPRSDATDETHAKAESASKDDSKPVVSRKNNDERHSLPVLGDPPEASPRQATS